jgi:hypothetical protein
MDEQRIPRWCLYLCAILVLGGLGVQLYQYARTITNYPFTTYWSESFRIYSASLIYSPEVYGRQLRWPWLDPGRAVLDGLALIIPGKQIWMFRFWLAFLTTATSALASFLIIHRASRTPWSLNRKSGFFLATLVGWGILYFLQGPIYYHVLLGILPVLWLFDLKKPVRTLIVILVASAWEGICRVNWFGMPACIALLLYLLTLRVGQQRIGKYLKWPILWMLAGVCASCTAYYLFIRTAHYPAIFFNSTMHYGFFTFKLWPNIALKPGLILGITIISLPLLFLAAPVFWKSFRRLHWLRSITIIGILAVFFVGSTYVSLRAGGGFDLHNYDTFMILLFILGVYASFNDILFDREGEDKEAPSFFPAVALAINVVIPVSFAILHFHAPSLMMTREQSSAVLAQLVDIVEDVEPSQGPVLFIDQRQLLVYRLIPPVAAYQPYEKVELMEMAMANVLSYRDAFYSKIESHTYPVIISEIHVDAYQNPKAPFGYENNVWNDAVSSPILKYYRPIYVNKVVGIGVYAPAVK